MTKTRTLGSAVLIAMFAVVSLGEEPAKAGPSRAWLTTPPVGHKADEEQRLPSKLWWIERIPINNYPLHTIFLKEGAIVYSVVEVTKGTIVPKSAGDAKYEEHDALLETAPGIPAYRTRNAVLLGFRFDTAKDTEGALALPGKMDIPERMLLASEWAFVYIDAEGQENNARFVSEYRDEVKEAVQEFWRMKEQGPTPKPLPSNDGRILPGD